MSPITVTNTLTREKELFTPITPNKVSIYHCGPTVYWTQHIGNLRSATLGDFIRRTFLLNGYNVTYMRNYTDVGHLTGDNIGDADTGEDRMAKGAAREGLTPDQIAQKYITVFENDISKLNIMPPNLAEKATSHIDEMLVMVQILLDKGIAYTTPLAVYLDISKVNDYTKLSKQDISKLLSGSGHAAVSDNNKKNPGDFAVWFFKAGTHANALQTWPSPFISDLVQNGEGFPGWHIECSAMIHKFLGETIDIHIGGIEHIPIHHTNEIAQSESCYDAPLAHYWLHNAHLQVDNKKMAKSEGTSYVLNDITEKNIDPLVLRYFFLQAHYRSEQNFTWDALNASKKAFERLCGAMRGFDVESSGGGLAAPAEPALEYTQKFILALNNDFNTPAALAVVFEILDSDLPPATKKATILWCDQVLGLQLDSIKPINTLHDEIPPFVADLLAQRKEARDTKNYSESDRLRDLIAAEGFTVKDEAEGQKIYKA